MMAAFTSRVIPSPSAANGATLTYSAPSLSTSEGAAAHRCKAPRRGRAGRLALYHSYVMVDQEAEAAHALL